MASSFKKSKVKLDLLINFERFKKVLERQYVTLFIDMPKLLTYT